MNSTNDIDSHDTGSAAEPIHDDRTSDTRPQKCWGPYRDTTIHDEEGAVKHGASLSSWTYVPVQLRDYQGTPDPVLVKPRHRCNHGVTICRDCADSWALDHIIHYERTKAGRQLLDQVNTDQKQRATTPNQPTETTPGSDTATTGSPEHRPPSPGLEADNPHARGER
ncbi:hypothetical protein [Nocardia thraciensis]